MGGHFRAGKVLRGPAAVGVYNTEANKYDDVAVCFGPMFLDCSVCSAPAACALSYGLVRHCAGVSVAFASLLLRKRVVDKQLPSAESQPKIARKQDSRAGKTRPLFVVILHIAPEQRASIGAQQLGIFWDLSELH